MIKHLKNLLEFSSLSNLLCARSIVKLLLKDQQKEIADPKAALEKLLILREKSSLLFAKDYFFSGQHLRSLKGNSIFKEAKAEEFVYQDPRLIFGIRHSLRHDGVIKQCNSGMIYLDVSNDYIHKLFPFFEKEGAQKPLLEAHIPILSKAEWEELGHGESEFIGQKVQFEPMECKRITPLSSHLENAWILTIHSQILSDLRLFYGVKPKPNSLPFCMLLALKKNESKDHKEGFFLNPSLNAV